MNNDLVTAYVDNEISDESLLKQIKEQIDSNSTLKFEYNVQSFCKKIVNEKVKKVPAPNYLRSRIISEITPKEVVSKKKESVK